MSSFRSEWAPDWPSSDTGAPSGPAPFAALPSPLPPPPPPGAPAAPQVPVEPAGPSRQRGRGGLLAAVAATALLAGGTGGVVGALVARDGGSTVATGTATATSAPVAATSAPAAVPPLTDGGNAPPPAAATAAGGIDVRAVLAAMERSVVQVISGGGIGTASGTGFVISADGEVLTNAHVVNGARQVQVRFIGERQPRVADVVGRNDSADVALLKVRDVSGLATVRLGSIERTQVGDPVVAIGYALGLRGDPTVTLGIVSALDRSISQDLVGLVQTDTAINPGNSGGPLVNAAGEVIGINTASLGARGGQAENIGFAISIDDALSLAERFRAGQSDASYGFLGVSADVTADGSPGAEITALDPGTPAARAGLQVGDVIRSIDGQTITSPDVVGRVVRRAGAGAQVPVVVERNGQQLTVMVTLGAR